MFYKKGVLRENFIKFTGKHLCHTLFLNKVSGLFQCRHFPVNFAKLLRPLFFSEDFRWLLLSDVTKLKEKKKQNNLKMN